MSNDNAPAPLIVIVKKPPAIAIFFMKLIISFWSAKFEWKTIADSTQKPELRKNLNLDVASKKLSNFLIASTDLMKTLARACGHKHLSEFDKSDLTTWKLEMSKLSGVNFSGLEF